MKLLSEIDEPIDAASRIDILDPKRDIPYSDKADPRRIKDRTLIELPTLMKSSTEALEPTRENP
jgi:hypothetical protein